MDNKVLAQALMGVPFPRPRPNELAMGVVDRFKAIAPHELNVIDSRGSGMSDGRKIEFYPPDERDNPIPGRPTVEIFDPRFQGRDAENIVAADFMSHHLTRVDPRLRGMREQFRSSMTPEQNQIDQNAYQRAKAEYGEGRPYDQWFEQSRLDQYLGAPLLPESDPNRAGWERGYTPSQRALIDAMLNYLKTGQ